MTRPLDRRLSGIFLACRDYYLTNLDRNRKERGEMYKRLQEALTTTLRAMAALHAANYSDYTVDKEHVGYLIKFEPPMLFRVPYHVLPSFPTGDELEALWHLSRAIRSGNRSTISISGSNVLRKVFDIVGDIDFCEYFPISDVAGFDRIAANMDGNDKVACVALALAGREWHYPWGDDRPTKDFFANTIDISSIDKSTMKVDYVGDVGCLGVTEITNLVIAVDENGNSAGLTKTFAAQEAPLVPIDWLPNHMNDPIEMGRYVNWLIDSIVASNEKRDMRKCLKRCASLSRVLFVTDITEQIADLVSRSPILLSQKMNELSKLFAMLKPLTDARSQRLNELIEKQSKTLRADLSERGAPDEPARRRFDDEATRIVERLLKYAVGDTPSSMRAA